LGQQAWAELRANLVGRIDNLGCDVIGFHDPDFLAQSRGGRRERQNKNLRSEGESLGGGALIP
jgi:hypothetical protein